MTRINVWPVITTLLLCGVTACSTVPGKPMAKEVTWATMCTPENENQFVSIEGYVGSFDMSVCVNQGGKIVCPMGLYGSPVSGGAPASSRVLLLEPGTGNNQMEKAPSLRDYKFHTNNGTVLGVADKMRFTGKMIYATSDRRMCHLTEITIEKP